MPWVKRAARTKLQGRRRAAADYVVCPVRRRNSCTTPRAASASAAIRRALRDIVGAAVLVSFEPRLSNVPNLLLPPLVTMLAGGFWHGSSAHMLLWGGLHGVYLIVERLLSLRAGARRTRVQSPLRQVANGLVVFALGCWALVAFRVDASVALSWWWTMLRGAGGDLPDSRMLCYIAPSFWLDWMERRHGGETTFDHWPRGGRAALLAVAMLLWFLMTRMQPSAPFIYRGF